MKKIAIIGGGASGFFLASNLGKELGAETTLFEQSSSPLQKVKVSGGGRCNLTNACFDPKELVEFYPRGSKELLSVFHKFQPEDTMEWFQNRGVDLKIEDDNRIFPMSNSSMSIIDCLLNEIGKNEVEVRLGEGVQNISKEGSTFIVKTKSGESTFNQVIFASGSSNKSWAILKNLGHTIVEPVPSLFTFNVKDRRLEGLMGISFENVTISIPEIKIEAFGSILITHWGLSGPSILRLSAWGARELAKVDYDFQVKINFTGMTEKECSEFLSHFKNENGKKSVYKINPFSFPKRFWQRLLALAEVPSTMSFSHLTKTQIQFLAKELTNGLYHTKGKSTFKEEFVTAGGVELKEINFKNMESKLVQNLFLAGETLNIDAITGGFNFQACWSEAYLISSHLKSIYNSSMG